MILRTALAVLVAATLGAPPLAAQSRGETLADIRQELSILYVEMQHLKTELSTTGNTSVATGGQATLLERVDALEGELRRLTAKTERLEYRIDRIVRDGTNRIGDLEFRLVELEGGDVSKLGQSTTLGGDGATDGDSGSNGAGDTGINGTGTGTGAGETGTGELAVGERADFDAAMAAYDNGDFARAVELFTDYGDTYPGGPLAGSALFWKGEAFASMGDWTNAARSFLDSFSFAPNGRDAPRALLRLGVSLERIGQHDEACLTLREVAKRYPGAEAVGEAEAQITSLACGG